MAVGGGEGGGGGVGHFVGEEVKVLVVGGHKNWRKIERGSDGLQVLGDEVRGNGECIHEWGGTKQWEGGMISRGFEERCDDAEEET